MSLAILPGSYDPMTLGHLDLVNRALEEYDEVVVAIMVNPQKKTLFDMETRVEIAKKTVEHLSRVRVVSDTGMLIDLFDRLGADAVCKGYRNRIDYEYEKEMADWNARHNPRFQTVLYEAKREHVTFSSTEARRLLKEGGSLEGLVHPNAIPLILRQVK